MVPAIWLLGLLGLLLHGQDPVVLKHTEAVCLLGKPGLLPSALTLLSKVV